MFAYCGNNPILFSDGAGTFFVEEIAHKIKIIVVRCIISIAPSLLDYDEDEMSSLDENSYNCVGNGLGKQINCFYIPGYKQGMSTRQAFGLIQEIVGKDNIRELNSVDDRIGEDEFRGAFRCGPEDLHFIRQLSNGQWYNKSGTTHGVPIPEELVVNGISAEGYWFAIYLDGNEIKLSYPYYDDEIIYYALKKEWWKQ